MAGRLSNVWIEAEASMRKRIVNASMLESIYVTPLSDGGWAVMGEVQEKVWMLKKCGDEREASKWLEWLMGWLR